MKEKSESLEIEASRSCEIDQMIIDILEGYKGITTLAARQILYRLVELSLVNRDEKCHIDCNGMSIEFNLSGLRIQMPANCISSSLDDIYDGLHEFMDDFCGFFGISTENPAKPLIELYLQGKVWRGLCSYSERFGTDYLASHKNVLDNHHPIDRLDLYPEYKGLDDEAIAQRLFDKWDQEEESKKEVEGPKKSK